MRIVQAHNRHGSRGGADQVMDTERELLEAAGHRVEQFLVPAAGSSSRIAEGLAATWNRDATARLGELLDRFEADVLHVHTPFPVMSPAVFRTAKRRGVATVATLHSFRYSCISGTLLRDGSICEDCVGKRWKTAGVRHGCYHDSPVASAALTLSLGVHASTFRRAVDRFLPLTGFARDLLVREGIAPDRITVKPNCTADPGVVVPAAQRDPAMLFVGRLVPEKGIETLLAAWASMPEPIGLRIVGDGPLAPRVEAAAAADPRITWLGARPQREVEAYQRHARATVVPSLWYEGGQPLVMLDAFAAGTPVVCSDLENIVAEPAARGAAIGFATGSPEALAAAVREIYADPARAAAVGAAGRATYLERHTPQRSLDALEQCYREVARSAHEPHPAGER